jgi:hypothetical protein
MRFLKIAAGFFGGGIAGAALGVAVSIAIGVVSQWTHPNDPTAGSVAIIAIALVPAGGFLGAGCGTALVVDWTAKRRDNQQRGS